MHFTLVNLGFLVPFVVILWLEKLIDNYFALPFYANYGYHFEVVI